MAQSTKPGAERIYGIHRRWLTDTLPNGDSLLTPGSAVWIDENLGELDRSFSCT